MLSHCDGSNPDIVSAASCSIPLYVLIGAPYDLVLGDHIFAKIQAHNIYGISLESVPGDGSAMVQMPDAPINLANNPTVTAATQIGLIWNTGLSDGGKDILDYQVTYYQGIGIDVVLESTVPSTSYTATNLTPGNTYIFKVQARNSVGLSAYSNEVSILAAQVPNQPLAPLTSITTDGVIISWKSPYNGGSLITSYTITIRQDDGATFTSDSENCDGSDPVIILERKCTVPISVLRAEPYNLPWGSYIYAKVQATNVMVSSLTSFAGNGAQILRAPDAP